MDDLLVYSAIPPSFYFRRVPSFLCLLGLPARSFMQ